MRALILVDIQNDFVPGGALAVPRGDEVIAVANDLMGGYAFVVATQDWHPADHLSFASQHAGRAVGDTIDLDGQPQILWPDHCVQGTGGAELCADLDRTGIHEIVRKGTDRQIDSYSGFFDNGGQHATGLSEVLQARGVAGIDVMGLATDYCVKFTALDGVRVGLQTRVLSAGIRGVELQPGDCARALEDLRATGIEIIDRP